MIIKTFEINRKKFDKENFFLIYGENEGLKNEIIKIIKKIWMVILKTTMNRKLLVITKCFMRKCSINHFLKKVRQ